MTGTGCCWPDRGWAPLPPLCCDGALTRGEAVAHGRRNRVPVTRHRSGVARQWTGCWLLAADCAGPTCKKGRGAGCRRRTRSCRRPWPRGPLQTKTPTPREDKPRWVRGDGLQCQRHDVLATGTGFESLARCAACGAAASSSRPSSSAGMQEVQTSFASLMDGNKHGSTARYSSLLSKTFPLALSRKLIRTQMNHIAAERSRRGWAQVSCSIWLHSTALVRAREDVRG